MVLVVRPVSIRVPTDGRANERGLIPARVISRERQACWGWGR